MRKYFILLAIFLAFLPGISFSADRSVTCDSPEGSRMDYFITNAMNLENDKFIMARDRIGNAKIDLLIKENNQSVIFKLGDGSSEMKVLLSNDEQVTFDGIFNGAPIMATYYFLPQIIVFSQQSVWPSGENTGARAVIFYAHCKDQSSSVPAT